MKCRPSFTSPFSYATRASPSYDDMPEGGRRSRSNSSSGGDSPQRRGAKPGKVEFITSFGGESEDESAVVLPQTKAVSSSVKSRLKRLKKSAAEDDDEGGVPTVPFGPMLPSAPEMKKTKDKTRSVNTLSLSTREICSPQCVYQGSRGKGLGRARYVITTFIASFHPFIGVMKVGRA